MEHPLLSISLLHSVRSSAAPCAHPPFMHGQVANRLVERLDDIHESYRFAEVIDLGCGTGHVRRALSTLGNSRGIERLREFDMSEAMLERSRADLAVSPPVHGPEGDDFAVEHILADEEELGLEKESVDLIISCMGLHWVNDLPGTIRMIRRALKPNGLFLCAFLGGETLAEMRSSFVSGLSAWGGIGILSHPRFVSFAALEIYCTSPRGQALRALAPRPLK
eukprot:scaffold50791_cov26-Tisochrysis_lutea.AAC.4